MGFKNFYKQKGVIPTLVKSVGYLFHAFFILGSIYLGISMIAEISMKGSFPISTILSALLAIPLVFAILAVPLIAGALFVNAFPEIRCTDNGLEARVYKIFKTTFNWNEVKEIIDAPYDIKALVIKRRGFNLVNGLYSNQIYGHIIKSKNPVLLLSSDLENRDVLILNIETRISKNL